VKIESWDLPSVEPTTASYEPPPPPRQQPEAERCPECGAPRRPDADTCPQCGTELGGADEAASATATAPQ
jgi:hypothetical protein